MDADFKQVTLRVAVVDVVILGDMALYSSAAQKFPEATLTQKQNWLPQTCHRTIIQLMHKRALSLSLPGCFKKDPEGRLLKSYTVCWIFMQTIYLSRHGSWEIDSRKSNNGRSQNIQHTAKDYFTSLHRLISNIREKLV